MVCVGDAAFDSEFCRVEYRMADSVVFLAWKKFCRLEDYRRPAHFELELLQEHPGCFLVIAARNGFEDDPADVEMVLLFFASGDG